MIPSLTILQGGALEKLRELPDESVHCCVTSPPYWGLRDYGTAECSCGAKRIDSQLGLEKTPEEYVARMVEIFREVRRVLRKDGTLWLNLGDSYSGSPRGNTDVANFTKPRNEGGLGWSKEHSARGLSDYKFDKLAASGLKPKDLVGIPWRLAFALQADGWYLRSDIIWSKPNLMPESVTDRPTKAHEYLFLLTKSARYFYDSEAIKERCEVDDVRGPRTFGNGGESRSMHRDNGRLYTPDGNGRNKRSVWTVATAPYPEAHFATYPPDLIKPCILAGTSARGCCAKCGAPWERITETTDSPTRAVKTNGPHGEHGFMGGNRRDIPKDIKTLGWKPTCLCQRSEDRDQTSACTVLDCFAGSGTTGAVALELGRCAILIELNPEYVELIEQRCNTTLGLALA